MAANIGFLATNAAIGPEAATTPFDSVLFPHGMPGQAPDGPGRQAFLVDLQLNQIIDTIVAGREQYNLKPFFHLPLNRLDEVAYRHEVFEDLRDATLLAALGKFAGELAAMRADQVMAKDFRLQLQHDAMVAEAAAVYSRAVETLGDELAGVELHSHALRGFRDYLGGYRKSAEFLSLAGDARHVREALAGVRYCFRIKGSKVSVTREDDNGDYTAEVRDTFARFRQVEEAGHESKHRFDADMDHVESMILDRVALLFPLEFGALADFQNAHASFTDEVLIRFDREIQFYLAFLDLAGKLSLDGLPFTLPTVSDSKELHITDTFDLSLAANLAGRAHSMVLNDIHLDGAERILVVSGPNQGGKTTYARTVGQIHYLASLGLPVAGTHAEVFLPDAIFTHFELGENAKDLRGKLMDDLVRIHDILDQATPRSLVILNEIFTSTTLQDAIDLGSRILTALTRLDVLCVCVTFVDELSRLGPSTVSMVSTVDRDDPATRTFKIVRQPADGLAYAMVLAKKYRLDYQDLKGRITP